MALDLAALSLGPLVTSAKGAKQAPISAGIGPAAWAPPGYHDVAFEPKPYVEEATRVNLVLRAGTLEEQLRALDDWAVTAAAAVSEQLFGKALTKEQAAERYTPLLKESEKYAATFRLKMNVAGKGAVRLWTPSGQRREPPERWTMCSARPMILFKGLWVMGRDFGILAETTDVQLEERGMLCPF